MPLEAQNSRPSWGRNISSLRWSPHEIVPRVTCGLRPFALCALTYSSEKGVALAKWNDVPSHMSAPGAPPISP